MGWPWSKCPDCDGEGNAPDGEACTKCEGLGEWKNPADYDGPNEIDYDAETPTERYERAWRDKRGF